MADARSVCVRGTPAGRAHTTNTALRVFVFLVPAFPGSWPLIGHVARARRKTHAAACSDSGFTEPVRSAQQRQIERSPLSMRWVEFLVYVSTVRVCKNKIMKKREANANWEQEDGLISRWISHPLPAQSSSHNAPSVSAGAATAGPIYRTRLDAPECLCV